MANRETWSGRVSAWKRSGLTAEKFAQREGLKATTLTWWSSQLGRGARPPVVEVRLAPDEGARAGLEVVLATSGARVAVPVGFDGVTLTRLLTVLEGR